MSIQRVNTDLFVGVLAGLIALHLLKSFYSWVRSFWTLPPGPWGLPIVGIMKWINKPFHLYLTDLAQKYGGLFSLKMGQETMIVLADHKLIKEAFAKNKMTARPQTEIIKEILKGLGIVNSEGNLWKENRSFLLRNNMGMKFWDGTRMDNIAKTVRSQVRQLVTTIDGDFNGVPVDPTALFNCAISNVICSMVMSKSFLYTDPQFQRFMSNFDEGFKLFTETGAVMFIPWLKYLSGISDSCKKLHANREEMLQFVRQVIEEHKADLDPAKPKDLIDIYLVEQMDAETKSHKNLFQDRKPMEQIEQVVLDLFSAGVETLKTSLLWSVVYMVRNPDVLAKVQAELDAVVGDRSLPEMDHFQRLPYTRATLYEVMRCSSVVPMGTTHATNNAMKFEGFDIPKNTHVIPLLCAVHMNPDIFPEPDQFQPERFLQSTTATASSESGGMPVEVVKPEGFMPFGYGSRMCLGEHLAERQLFLFFVSIMHAFNLHCSQGVPSLEGVAGAAVAPKSFNVTFSVRKPLVIPTRLDRPSEQQA